MGILSRLGFGGSRTEVYCQSCGIELTNIGGVVDADRSYCSDLSCISPSLLPDQSWDYPRELSPRGLQKAIRSGRLVHYSKPTRPTETSS